MLPSVSFGPCCLQVEPDRVKTHAAPAGSLSSQPPTRAVLPLPDSATPEPKLPPTVSLPTSFGPCCVHVEPERVNTHAAPRELSSPVAPMRAVLPSADRATLAPKFSVDPMNDCGSGISPLPIISGPWIQPELERVNTHTAPLPSTDGAPSNATFPLPDSATVAMALEVPLGTGCSIQDDPEGLKINSGPPTTAMLPSPARANVG